MAALVEAGPSKRKKGDVRIITSWYPAHHFLINFPKEILEKIILEYLVAKDMHSLVLSSFVKQLVILLGGNDVDAYKAKFILKYDSRFV